MAADSRFADQSLLQVFAETGRVRHRESDVFIEMKQLDILPVDIRGCGQRIKKIELGSAGCSDNSRRAALTNRVADKSRGLLSGCFARFFLFVEDLENHASLLSCRLLLSRLRGVHRVDGPAQARQRVYNTASAAEITFDRGVYSVSLPASCDFSLFPPSLFGIVPTRWPLILRACPSLLTFR
jgi:hypothetical protein